MRAKSVMSDGVMSVAADATILEVAELLVNTQVRAMPVVDKNGVMVGIVSEADVIRWVRNAVESNVTPNAGRDVDLTPAAVQSAKVHLVIDVMTRDVVTADENAPLREVAELMHKHGIKRVPILRDQAVVGIVSQTDLLQALVSVGSEAYAHAPPEVDPADAELHVAVMDALRDHSPAMASRCDLVVSKGVVHLWGTATSAGERDACEQVAKTVPGVAEVDNHLHAPRR